MVSGSLLSKGQGEMISRDLISEYCNLPFLHMARRRGDQNLIASVKRGAGERQRMLNGENGKRREFLLISKGFSFQQHRDKMI